MYICIFILYSGHYCMSRILPAENEQQQTADDLPFSSTSDFCASPRLLQLANYEVAIFIVIKARHTQNNQNTKFLIHHYCVENKGKQAK